MAAEHVLVLISVDPEASHRTNEAIRIALGIIAGENDVMIVLLGPAAKVFRPEVEDYVDGEDILKHVTTLKKLGQPFHVERGAISQGSDWNPDGLTIIPVGAEELPDLIRKSDRVLVF
ncbi:MAG: DsrE family protein [Candidatus Rokuibacteriota bacterium]